MRANDSLSWRKTLVNILDIPKDKLNRMPLDDFEPLVLDQIHNCARKLESFLEQTLPAYEVLFNLRGRAAGQLRYSRRGQKLIKPVLRFNRTLMEQNRSEFLNEVIPHELSHLAAYAHWGTKIRPHGREWKWLMVECFGLEARVTHDFEVATRPRKTVDYGCKCQGRVHALTMIRHNRIQRGQNRYLCLDCKSELKPF